MVILLMKKIWILLTSLLLLSGCTPNSVSQPVQETEAITQTTVPETTLPDSAPDPTHAPTEEAPIMHIPSTKPLEPKDTDLVRVRDYIPDVAEELIYATAENFTGAVIYDFQDIYLRYGSVKKLMAVQEELHTMGLGIKIWDGFRPVSAQFKLWEICPDDTYVANPNLGYSNHSRGFAVDLTIVDANGNELEMPTEFDDFSGKADRNYSDVSEVGKKNALLLEGIMQKHGFQGYYGEWWHYNDTTRYEVEKVFEPSHISCWKVISEDPAILVESPSQNAAQLSIVEPGQVVTVMGYTENYVMVTYQGIRGYLESPLLFPV